MVQFLSVLSGQSAAKSLKSPLRRSRKAEEEGESDGSISDGGFSRKTPGKQSRKSRKSSAKAERMSDVSSIRSKKSGRGRRRRSAASPDVLASPSQRLTLSDEEENSEAEDSDDEVGVRRRPAILGEVGTSSLSSIQDDEPSSSRKSRKRRSSQGSGSRKREKVERKNGSGSGKKVRGTCFEDVVMEEVANVFVTCMLYFISELQEEMSARGLEEEGSNGGERRNRRRRMWSTTLMWETMSNYDEIGDTPWRKRREEIRFSTLWLCGAVQPHEREVKREAEPTQLHNSALPGLDSMLLPFVSVLSIMARTFLSLVFRYVER